MSSIYMIISFVYSHYVSLLILPLLCALIHWHFTKTFDHWKKRGVDHEKPVIFFGNVKDRILFRTSFHEFQMKLYKRFKGQRFGGIFEGRRPSLFILDPELLKNVLVRDFDHFMDRPVLQFRDSPYIQNMILNLKGQRWKAVRSQMTPAFTSGKLKSMEPLIRVCAKQMEEYLDHSVQEGEIEAKDFFGRFTMDVIASCAFGVQCNSLKDPDAEFIKETSKFNDLTIFQRISIFSVLILAPQLSKYLPMSFFNMNCIRFLAHVVKKTKQYRLEDNQHRRNDFLQLMLDAESDTSGNNDINNKETGISNNNISAITEDTVIAQSILFLIAGFETSSTLLTFASYELALNVDVQDKLRNEITTVLDKYDGECNYHALNEMHYLEMVLCEALRKHPPIARVDRVCTQKYQILDTNIVLNPGESISVPVMGLHYDPEYYPDPEKFDPNRFSQEKKNERSPYVFLPFGAGPRNCIGLRFAMLSTKAAMVHLLKGYRIKTSVKTQVPYKYSKFSMLLKSVDGMWLKLEKL